jgi:hypothetical protein
MLRLSRNVGIKTPFFARSFAKAVPLKLGTPSGKCAHAIVDAAKAKKGTSWLYARTSSGS